MFFGSLAGCMAKPLFNSSCTESESFCCMCVHAVCCAYMWKVATLLRERYTYVYMHERYVYVPPVTPGSKQGGFLSKVMTCCKRTFPRISEVIHWYVVSSVY